MLNTVAVIRYVALDPEPIIDRLTLSVFDFLGTASTLCGCPACQARKDDLLEAAALAWVMGLSAYHAYMAMRDVYYFGFNPTDAVLRQGDN